MTGHLNADLSVSRPGGFRLDFVDEITPGEVVAVMGPSGAGKSTLLSALAGLEPIDEGSIHLDGRVVSRARARVTPHRRGVVLLGQDPRLFPHLSARANIAFGLRAQGHTATEAARTAGEWLSRVGLPDAGDRLPRELSGGQQQRVALARALATKPAVLLLDEPLTALDPETAGEIRAVIAEQLALARTTTIVVTHDAVDAAALAGRLILLEGGRVTQSGQVYDVLTTPETPFGATLAGLNRVVGDVSDASGGSVWTAGGLSIRIAHGEPVGARMAALFRPSAVSVSRPDENGTVVDGVWDSRILRLEQTPVGVRVHTSDPAIAADLRVDEVARLGFAAGQHVRLQVAPEDVRVVRADS